MKLSNALFGEALSSPAGAGMASRTIASPINRQGSGIPARPIWRWRLRRPLILGGNGYVQVGANAPHAIRIRGGPESGTGAPSTRVMKHRSSSRRLGYAVFERGLLAGERLGERRAFGQQPRESLSISVVMSAPARPAKCTSPIACKAQHQWRAANVLTAPR